MRVELRTTVLGVLFACVSAGWAAEPNSEQAKAIAEIEKLGGKVTVDEKSPGRPAVEVDFRGTKVTDTGLIHLRQLPALNVLYLNGTRVTDAGLVHLKGLLRLEELSLDDTKITGVGLASLNGLPRLDCLVLYGTQVTDVGLKSLNGLPRLTWLDLGKTKVTDAGLEHLKFFTKLQILHLGGTQLTDAGLEHLRGMTQLQELVLDDTRVTDAGLTRLKTLTRLESLSLVGTPITDAGLKHLTGASALESLFLMHTKVTADGVEDLQEALPICQLEWKPIPPPIRADTPASVPPAEDQSASEKEADPAADSRALIKTLKMDTDPIKRRNAALALAEQEWDIRAEAIQPLAAAIRHDKEEIVRTAAVDALLFHDGAAQMPWDVLINALHDRSARVRVRAAVAIDAKLGGHEDEEASDWTKEPLLVKAGQDRDQVVHGLVALAVGKKTTDLKATLPVLLAALRQDDASPMPAVLWGRTLLKPRPWAISA